ncbi:hypothetical protein ACET3X_004283 [Alternaria dauci]|uniref:O-methyltransferase C-terminal domain-containing protein n=1 Tax=Alternaria dauci TaxID=48095 RepID=A0ABR3UMI3_9PLEO
MGSIQQREIATLNSLAAQISELAAKMTKQLEAENVTPVTLEADSPIKYEKLPGDVFMTRQLLEDALKDMWILSQGPSESVFNYVHMAIPDTACLNVLNQFDFWAKDSGGEVWGDYETSWEFIENDGEGEKKGWRQRNFVKFMAYIKDLFQTENIVLNALDWKAEGEVTVVDLGGSAGHDDAVLATKFPNLKIVVQDLPEVAPVFEKEFPPELKSRVSFRTHNLFDPQPVQADIYVLKWILHGWPDVESVKILQALRPALRPGDRVLFIDYVGKQEPSDKELPRRIQGFGTATDLRMMAIFNAKERPVEAWKEIFKQADERYEVVRVEADPLSFMCVLEAVWQG